MTFKLYRVQCAHGYGPWSAYGCTTDHHGRPISCSVEGGYPLDGAMPVPSQEGIKPPTTWETAARHAGTAEFMTRWWLSLPRHQRAVWHLVEFDVTEAHLQADAVRLGREGQALIDITRVPVISTRSLPEVAPC